jgi:hypothetical protein
MIRILFSVAVAPALFGCARDRDFAVVEPTLSRHYQNGPTATLAAAPPVTRGNVVGIQPVAGQKGVVQPVYQSQPPSTAAGAMGSVVLPPASSTGAPVGGQPYYLPTAPNVASTPPAPPASMPLPPNTAVNGTPAGVYPAASGMWMPTQGNQTMAIHQFSTPTTGSSFMPSVPVNGATASSMRSENGVVPAGAMVPFQPATQQNGPPPQTARTPFMSDTDEHKQATRIESRPKTSAPPADFENPRATPMPPAKSPAEPPLATRREPRPEPPPVRSSRDDVERPADVNQRKRGDILDANPADPPRTRREVPFEKKSPPSNIKIPDPGTKSKNEMSVQPKAADDLDSPPSPLPAPKKPAPKKESSDPPPVDLPDDGPPAPPKRTGS